MPSNNVIEFVSQAEERQIFFVAIILPLARMIHAGQIDPETVTREGLRGALRELGRTNDDAFEIYVTRVEEEMRLIEHCIAEGEANSGIVLLFTLLEGEVNTLLRMHLGIGASRQTLLLMP